MDEPRSLDLALSELSLQMPPGVEVLAVREVSADSPPLQRSIYAADYEVVCPEGTSAEQVEREVSRVRNATSLPRTRAREGKTTGYDLRPRIQELGLKVLDGSPTVRMRLRTDAQGAGRADEVVLELGLDPADCSMVRTRLLLSEDHPATEGDG